MTDILELTLTPTQVQSLAPLVRHASAARQNVLLISTAAPDGLCWRFQCVAIPFSKATRVLKVIREAAESKESKEASQ